MLRKIRDDMIFLLGPWTLLKDMWHSPDARNQVILRSSFKYSLWLVANSEPSDAKVAEYFGVSPCISCVPVCWCMPLGALAVKSGDLVGRSVCTLVAWLPLTPPLRAQPACKHKTAVNNRMKAWAYDAMKPLLTHFTLLCCHTAGVNPHHRKAAIKFLKKTTANECECSCV
jgi:hypothetical protein